MAQETNVAMLTSNDGTEPSKSLQSVAIAMSGASQDSRDTLLSLLAHACLPSETGLGGLSCSSRGLNVSVDRRGFAILSEKLSS